MSAHKTWGNIIKGAAIAAGAVTAAAFGADYLGEVAEAVIGNVDTAAIEAAETAAENVDKIREGQETLSAAADALKDVATDTTATGIAGADAAADSALNAAAQIETLKSGISPAASAAIERADALAAAADKANTGLLGTIAENKLESIAIGSGIGALIAANAHAKEATSAREDREERASFAEREDMRRTQALMLARMQAQSYPPAMAMNAASMGRS